MLLPTVISSLNAHASCKAALQRLTPSTLVYSFGGKPKYAARWAEVIRHELSQPYARDEGGLAVIADSLLSQGCSYGEFLILHEQGRFKEAQQLARHHGVSWLPAGIVGQVDGILVNERGLIRGVFFNAPARMTRFLLPLGDSSSAGAQAMKLAGMEIVKVEVNLTLFAGRDAQSMIQAEAAKLNAAIETAAREPWIQLELETADAP